MDSNKDEGLRCQNMARSAFQEGDYDRAIRLIEKAHRLYPTESTKMYMKRFKDAKIEASKGAESGPRRRATARAAGSSEHGSATASPGGSTYTREQADLCKAVLNAKNYYEVLGLPRGATGSELKKAYKKLALLLHPDKNKAPNAEDAFKRISSAFQCLIDPERKEHYDKFGTERGQGERISSYYRQEHFISPEDLFQEFFGLHINRGSSGVGHGRFPRDMPPSEDPNSNLGKLFKLVPFFFILLIILLSSLGPRVEKHRYSFNYSRDFPVRVITQRNSVPYYGASDYYRVYPDGSAARERLDDEVELTFYMRKCETERARLRHTMYNSPSYISRKNMAHVETPYCDKFRILQQNISI